MQNVPTMESVKLMTDEEFAALNRELTKKLIRNVVIFTGVKFAILYGIHRWAKSVAKNA